MTNIKLKQLAFVLLSSIAFTALTQTSALACLATDPACKGALDTTSNTTTNVTINLNGNGLKKLNKLTGIVIPVSQVNSGNVNSVTNVYSPVANTLTATSTAIGNVVSLNLDQKATVVSNQFNSGAIYSFSDVSQGGDVTKSIDLSSTAIGNAFNASLNVNAENKPGSLAAAIAQCNTGNISAVAQYTNVDPDSLSVTSTAIGNVASVANTGVKISVR